MTRTLLTAILVILFSQIATADNNRNVLDYLDKTDNVSRIEFSLLKIQNELQKEFDEDRIISKMLQKIKVSGAYSIDENLIGLLVSARCNREREGLLAQSEMADIIAKDTLAFFSNYGNPKKKNIEGNNILSLTLGKKFSKYVLQVGADKGDFEKMVSLGTRLVDIFIVRVDISCKGTGSSFAYELDATYSFDSPHFDDKSRQLIDKY